MDYDMIVYESAESRARDPEDATRFDGSISKLDGVGIVISRVMCASPADITEEEAFESVTESGMSVLPVTTYQGTVIVTGAYPTDQDLADFLDAPDGVLSVNKTSGPAMANDIMPACDCGNKNACSMDRM